MAAAAGGGRVRLSTLPMSTMNRNRKCVSQFDNQHASLTAKRIRLGFDDFVTPYSLSRRLLVLGACRMHALRLPLGMQRVSFQSSRVVNRMASINDASIILHSKFVGERLSDSHPPRASTAPASCSPPAPVPLSRHDCGGDLKRHSRATRNGA